MAKFTLSAPCITMVEVRRPPAVNYFNTCVALFVLVISPAGTVGALSMMGYIKKSSLNLNMIVTL